MAVFDIEAVQRAIRVELELFGEEWLSAARQWLTDHNTDYTGATRENLYAEIFENIDETILEAGSRTGVSLWVHQGRGPGRMPPVHKIRDWVQIKLGVKDTRRATSLAWAIAKTIAAKGTRGQPFLQEPLNELLPALPGRLERAIENALE